MTASETPTTTFETYDDDLEAASKLIERFISPDQCGGNGRDWINDKLNNAWIEGITVPQWVALAVSEIPAGFRRSAE